MRYRILIAAGIIGAFLMGAMANGIYTTAPGAFNPAAAKSIAVEQSERTSPVVTRTHFAQPGTVYVSNPSPASRAVAQSPKKRSLKREALIVGGSAGAGAAIGAVAGGKKGAAVGALSGGIAGLVYDLATRNK
jgi:hypothetical protein